MRSMNQTYDMRDNIAYQGIYELEELVLKNEKKLHKKGALRSHQLNQLILDDMEIDQWL